MKNLDQNIGILSPINLLFTSLKREAIYFDAIGIPNILNDYPLKNYLTICPIRAIEYLIDKEIVFDPVDKYLGQSNYLNKIGIECYNEKLKEIEIRKKEVLLELSKVEPIKINRSDSALIQLLTYPWNGLINHLKLNIESKFGTPIRKIGAELILFFNRLDYDNRGMAIDLRDNFSVNAFPIYPSLKILNDNFKSGNNDVVEVVLHSIPEPDFETTSWEQIIDFRNDPDTKKKLNNFRIWIQRITKSGISENELYEEITYYLNQYEEHIKYHRMKINRGIFETLLMASAEIIEGLFFKPTKIVKALFTFKHKKLELLEAELKAPGRDLAYLLKAKEEFEGKNITHQ